MKTSEPRDWQKLLRNLGEIDWRIENPKWQGVAVHGGRVNNTATSIRMLATALEDDLSTTATGVSA